MRIVGTIIRELKVVDGIRYCCIKPTEISPCIHKSLGITLEDDKESSLNVVATLVEKEDFFMFAAVPIRHAALGDTIEIVAEVVESHGDFFVMPNMKIIKIRHTPLYNNCYMKCFWEVVKSAALN